MMLRRRKIFSVAMILILLASVLAGCGNESNAEVSGQGDKGQTASQADNGQTKVQMAPARAEHVVNVKVEEITPRSLTDVLNLPGETEAVSDVTLAAERSGVVEWVGVEEGHSVKAGSQVARIDVATLQAALERARANHKLAEQQLKRRQDLFAKKVLSREELEQAETERSVSKANMREAEVEYNQGVVSSPVTGIVNEVYVDKGEYINVGSPVCDIVDVSRLEVNFSVPEMDVRYLKEGQKALVTVDAYPARKWEGVIDFVAWKADSATRTFKVQVLVDNADGVIRPGMIARASFVRRQLDDAVTVPLFSVIDRGGERLVFVEEDGVAHARTVEIGVIETDRVQILKGVSLGDRLIVAGHREVEDGTKVNVR